jgi:hypothetical protein
VVRLGPVELREVEPRPRTVVEVGRGQELEPAVEAPAVRRAGPHRAEAAPARPQLPAREVAPATGDDVHDGEEGAVAVERGARADHHLDAVHEVHVDGEVVPDADVVEDVLVDAHAVDQHQDVAVEVAHAPEAPHRDVLVVAVVRGVEAGHPLEHLREGAAPVLADLLVPDDEDREGRVPRILLAARGGVDDLHLHQLREAHPGDVPRRGAGRRLSRCRDREERGGEERKPRRGEAPRPPASGDSGETPGESSGRLPGERRAGPRLPVPSAPCVLFLRTHPGIPFRS